MDAVIRETHISVVALIGDRAYKFMKPIRTAFVDQSTSALRRQACERELELNRRIAPDVYLGLGEIREGDVPTDTCIVMRRMPDDRRLSVLVGTDELWPAIRLVARQVAAFHARLTPDALSAEVASSEAVGDLWRASLDQIDEDETGLLDRTVLVEVRDRAMQYLAGRDELFRRRIELGHARDGHGDLLADDIFVLDDGVRILDCLAFDDRLRCGDVLLDVAFLAMDLERLSGSDAAAEWLLQYRCYTNEHHPDSLAHFYIGYRALVRCKVRALRAAQGDTVAAAEAVGFLEQCRTHLVAAAPLLVVIGGSPGVGKTTVADHLAGDSLTVLSSDPIRKELAGIDPLQPSPQALMEGIYSQAASDGLYAQLLSRADRLLGLGETVVIDASWSQAARRVEARRLAAHRHVDIIEIRCVLPADLAAERIERRRVMGATASDATAQIASAMARSFDRWPEAIEFSTEMPLAELSRATADLAAHVRIAGRQPGLPPGELQGRL